MCTHWVCVLRAKVWLRFPCAGWQDPTKVRGGPASAFAGTAAMLQLRLLEVYLALPNANSFAPEHEALSKLCARSLRGPSPSSSSTGTLP